MATTKISTSSLSSLNKYDIASADNNYMETIASTLVGAGGASTVTFSNIPQGYKHLQIRILARGTFAHTQDNTLIQFNGDTGTNYSKHQLAGSGTAVSAEGFANQSDIYSGLYPAASASANIFGVAVIDILDYANTNKYKTVRTLSGNDQNGSGYVVMRSGLWMNTAAITSINLPIDAGNYAQYTRISLYGIKG